MKNILMMFFAFALVACGQNEAGKTAEPQYTTKAPDAGKEYVFAIHPLHNPARLFEIYGPLIDYLNRNIPGAVFRLEASRNYEEFEKKLYARQFDFALPNPYQTLNSLGHGYHVIVKMGDEYWGLLCEIHQRRIRYRRSLSIRKEWALQSSTVGCRTLKN